MIAVAEAPTSLGGLGGEPTLDDLIVEIWEGLTAHSPVACPVCGGEMRPQYSAHPRPVGGRCLDCGAHLR
jgi:hypothetical protein